MTTIVFAHPSHDSFNYVEVQAIEEKLKSLDQPYRLIDLYADGFSPVLTTAELAQQRQGKTDDPLVRQYQTYIAESSMVIFVFPIWWGEMPAMLKGFFDKVMLPGFAYTKSPDGALLPGLRIGRTMVVTTSGSETVMFGSYIEGYFISFILASIGMNGAEWYNCGNVHSIPPEAHRHFILSVTDRL